MTLDEARDITRIWSEFLEYANGKLLKFFMSEIPEYFLPFTKKTIEEAVNIIAEDHHKHGNHEVVKALQATISALLFYADNEKAVYSLLKRTTNNPSWFTIMLKNGTDKRY